MMINNTFIFTQSSLKNIANTVLKMAQGNGATSAQIILCESISTSVSILNNEIDNIENSYATSIGLTTYINDKVGYADTTSFEEQSLQQLVKYAGDIAITTENDPANGIPESETLCQQMTNDLSLYHTLDIKYQTLINMAKKAEKIALSLNKKVNKSDGTVIDIHYNNFVLANSNSFNSGYQTSKYAKSITLISQIDDIMHTDYTHSIARDFNDLTENVALANLAVDRVLRRVDKADAIESGKYDIIFEAEIAQSIIYGLVSALTGSNLFRRISFLCDSLGECILPQWVNIYEDPFITKGIGSAYFDEEGVALTPHFIIQDGLVKNYILSTYTARKLNMSTTGNAGGVHNLIISNNTTDEIMSIAETKLKNGIIIIETMGSGLNLVTGDYSVGACGLLVRDGEITGFLNNMTIAGNLKEIFQNIKYISNDYKTHNTIRCGSMLVTDINIAV